MFSHACVILSVHRGGGGFPAGITGYMNKRGLHLEGGLNPGGVCMGGGLHLGYYRIWLASRRYASYWNVYLFLGRSNIKTQQECIPVECVPSAAVAVGGRGRLPRGCVSQNVLGRGCVSHHALGGGGGTRACENITFPQLRLRTVKMLNLDSKSAKQGFHH